MSHSQRFYQAITSIDPPPGPPYTTTTNFASLRAGPGTAKTGTIAEGDPHVFGVTTFRVPTRDRTFVDEVEYKGWKIRLADWLHLANPDDPSRPIIAQVFKVFISDDA
jgi:chromatin structure-remodeling complex subunit RSC1/2